MPPSRRIAAGYLVAALLCAAHFTCFEILRSPLVWDMRFYTYFAGRTAAGAVPYRDYFENKTPLSIFAGALLHRLGQSLGIEPLHAIRAGFLAFAGAGGLLLFAVHRRLGGGRVLPGLLALVAYTGFALLGELPAIGVNPKTLMAVFASAAALLLARRRFILAGVAGTLAFWDWQIGALAFLGVLAGALTDRDQPWRSAGRVVLGGALGAAAFLAYFVTTGSLGPAFAQTLGTLLSRGAESAQKGVAHRLAHILDNVRVGCEGHVWLFALGLVGMLVYPVWLARRRRHSTLGMALGLAVYHYGVVAFSLFDYQSYGDLYILLHSVVFFSAVALVEAYKRLWALLRRQLGRTIAVGRPARFAAEAALVLAVALLARPSVLRSPLSLRPPTVDPGATLDDQRSVARRVLEAEASGRLAFVGPAELLYLAGRPNAVPFVYWNAVTHRFYRKGTREAYVETLDRMLRDSGATIMVGDRTLLPMPDDRVVASENGAYSVRLRPVLFNR